MKKKPDGFGKNRKDKSLWIDWCGGQPENLGNPAKRSSNGLNAMTSSNLLAATGFVFVSFVPSFTTAAEVSSHEVSTARINKSEIFLSQN